MEDTAPVLPGDHDDRQSLAQRAEDSIRRCLAPEAGLHPPALLRRQAREQARAA